MKRITWFGYNDPLSKILGTFIVHIHICYMCVTCDPSPIYIYGTPGYQLRA